MYNRFIILSIKFEKKSFGEYYSVNVKIIDDANKTSKIITIFSYDEHMTDEEIKKATCNYIEAERYNMIKEETINNTIKRLTGKVIDL